jgi:hypothetical protein
MHWNLHVKVSLKTVLSHRAHWQRPTKSHRRFLNFGVGRDEKIKRVGKFSYSQTAVIFQSSSGCAQFQSMLLFIVTDWSNSCKKTKEVFRFVQSDVTSNTNCTICFVIQNNKRLKGATLHKPRRIRNCSCTMWVNYKEGLFVCNKTLRVPGQFCADCTAQGKFRILLKSKLLHTVTIFLCLFSVTLTDLHIVTLSACTSMFRLHTQQ